jgi:hypothetical protein
MTEQRVINALPGMDAQKRRTIRERALSWLESGTAQQMAAAREVLDALAALEKQESEALARHVASLRKSDRIVEAFRKLPMSKSDRKVIQVLLDNPGLSSKALTKKVGWKALAWQLHFGLMCRDRGHLLWPAPFDEGRGADCYSGILADFDDETRGFTPKLETVEAFEKLGVRSSKAT